MGDRCPRQESGDSVVWGEDACRKQGPEEAAREGTPAAGQGCRVGSSLFRVRGDRSQGGSIIGRIVCRSAGREVGNMWWAPAAAAADRELGSSLCCVRLVKGRWRLYRGVMRRILVGVVRVTVAALRLLFWSSAMDG